jgi:3-methyladenine DNA glycosylase AlkD
MGRFYRNRDGAATGYHRAMGDPAAAALADDLLARLRAAANPAAVAGMARYGISSEGTLGVTVAALRGLAREVKRGLPDPAARHALAERLWRSGVHEGRILATIVDVPALVSEAQAERWIRGVDSWDVCDGLCNNLLDASPVAWALARAWPARPEEFVRRAGLVLLATRAVHDRAATDADFAALLPACEAVADDERRLVTKAASWALRQVGKRSPALRRKALASARRLAKRGSRRARWIASDVRRELERPEVVARTEARAGAARRPPSKRRGGRPAEAAAVSAPSPAARPPGRRRPSSPPTAGPRRW